MVATAGTVAYLFAAVTGRTGDIDIKTAAEAGLTIAVVSIVPLAVTAAGLLLPMGAVMNRALDARFGARGNALVGAALGVPATALFVVIGSLLWGNGRPLSAMLRIWLRPDPVLAVLVSTLICGGAVVGLGFRRKPSANIQAQIPNVR